MIAVPMQAPFPHAAKIWRAKKAGLTAVFLAVISSGLRQADAEQSRNGKGNPKQKMDMAYHDVRWMLRFVNFRHRFLTQDPLVGRRQRARVALPLNPTSFSRIQMQMAGLW